MEIYTVLPGGHGRVSWGCTLACLAVAMRLQGMLGSIPSSPYHVPQATLCTFLSPVTIFLDVPILRNITREFIQKMTLTVDNLFLGLNWASIYVCRQNWSGWFKKFLHIQLLASSTSAFIDYSLYLVNHNSFAIHSGTFSGALYCDPSPQCSKCGYEFECVEHAAVVLLTEMNASLCLSVL